MSVPKFSEFAENCFPLTGDKISIEKILNKEIKITGYKVQNSKYKDKNPKCLTVQFEDDYSEKRVFFSGSKVLIEQLEKYGDKIPFLATIQKIGKYYTLT